MKRNYGIDLLRIVSMIFVILLHIMGVGGVCANTQLFSPQFFLSQFVRIATFCAVNCYALISGFVGWNRRPKPSGLLNLWAKVILFCVAITVFTQLRAPEAVGLGDLWKAFTPVKEAKYWYFNAYVGLFFFLPLLNHGVRGISGRDAVFAMAGIFLVVLNVPNSKSNQVFLLANGYSTLWLMILYILGGLMGRFDIPGKLPAKFWALCYVLAVLGSFVPRMVMLALKPELWSPEHFNLSMQYLSPSVVLASAALVGLFARLELKGGLLRITKALSPHAFGVYLCHTHTLIFLTAIRGRFTWLGTAPVWELAAVTVGATVFIYAVGTAADWLLTRAMKLVRFDRLLKKLDGLAQGRTEKVS